MAEDRNSSNLQGGTSSNSRPENAEAKRKKLIQKKIKERKIRQLSQLEDERNSQPTHPTHFVLAFPGIDIESELNVIRANNEIIKVLGKPRKVAKMNKNSLLITVNESSQSEKILHETASGFLTSILYRIDY